MSGYSNSKRLMSFGGKNYEVARLYSSGLGEQFGVTEKLADGSLKTELLNRETVSKKPELSGLYERCLRLFENRTVFNAGDYHKN